MKRRFYSLAIAMMLLAGLVCAMAVPAFANYGGPNPSEFNGKVGQNAQFCLNPGMGLNIDRVTNLSGSVPPGMHYSVTGDGKLVISGTPTTAGFYQMLFDVHVVSFESYDSQLAALITIEGSSKPDYVLNTYYDTINVGKYARYSFDMECSGHISEMRINGTLPAGMTASSDSYGVYLAGTPTQVGVFNFNLRAYDSANKCWATQPVQLTIRGEVRPTVTKSPTSETVVDGSRALFVAHADNYSQINWTISSPNGSQQYNASDASRYFDGLRVSGSHGEVLTLDNVSEAMNGWQIQARFDSSAGSAYTNVAYIYVNPFVVNPPVFTKQPVGTTLKPGESTTLTVEAQSPDGNAIGYQWVKCTTSSVTSGLGIDGATGPSLTVPYEEGVFFYYCYIYCSNSNHYSDMVNSEMAAVTGEVPAPTTAPTEAPKETTAPTAAPTEAPTTVPTEAPAKPTEQAEQTEQTVPATQAPAQPAAKADHTVAYIVGGVASVSIVCATALLLQRSKGGRYEKDE